MPGQRILIVDDNPANATLISYLLTKKGYEVRTAADALEAVVAVGDFRPRLIMMDVQLPGMDGLELTRRLKADPHTRHIVIVALTAYAMKGDKERAHEAGCDGYLSKPIDTRTLPGTVAEYLKKGTRTRTPNLGDRSMISKTSTISTTSTLPPARDPSKRSVVLLVDDQLANRALVSAYLRASYDLVEAEDGAGAIRILKHQPVDLVLLDVMMPDMSGFEVCRLIKLMAGDDQYLPVILLTALGEQEDRNTGLEAGADDFLSKPVDRQELLLRVKTFVKLRRQDIRIRRQLAELAERDLIIRNQFEDLRAMGSLKDDLISLMVHDLRNPLTGIAGFLESLDTEIDDQEVRVSAQMALDSTNRLGETLDDMLQVRLLESGSVRIHRELIQADALVRDAIASVFGADRAGRVEIAPVTDMTDVFVAADRKLVRRAIENLLTNALKYSPAGGIVSASVRQVGDDVEIEVADRGRGIPDDVKAQLFQKFGSVEADRGEARRGVGLGLYLVKLVATAHGGRAVVRDRDGGGTAFGLFLPRRDSSASDDLDEHERRSNS